MGCLWSREIVKCEVELMAGHTVLSTSWFGKLSESQPMVMFLNNLHSRRKTRTYFEWLLVWLWLPIAINDLIKTYNSGNRTIILLDWWKMTLTKVNNAHWQRQGRETKIVKERKWTKKETYGRNSYNSLSYPSPYILWKVDRYPTILPWPLLNAPLHMLPRKCWGIFERLVCKPAILFQWCESVRGGQ